MLVLMGNKVIDHIEKPFNRDIKAEFLANLPDQCIWKPFAELDAATGELPFLSLVAGILPSLGKEKPAVSMYDDRTNAYTDVVDAFSHGNIVAREAENVQDRIPHRNTIEG